MAQAANPAIPASDIQDNQRVLGLNVYKFLILYLIAVAISFYIATPENTFLNWYLTFVWSLYCPVALIGFIRVARNDDVEVSSYSGVTEKRVIFLVPTVCRKDTFPALQRVVESVVKHAPNNINDWEVHILVEEKAEYREELKIWIASLHFSENIRVITIPHDYKTPRNTNAKARASHFGILIRRELNLHTKDTYVYHLDDDTHVGADTVASIAEFIDKYHGLKYLAQGILTFPKELSASRFCRMADSVRPMDDKSRFGLFTEDFGTPLAGLHGEHLLIRADIEEEIGWDFGSTLVEDAYFGLEFSRKYPGKSKALNSFSYGASPDTIRDFVRQRRRWAAGLIDLIFKRDLPFKTRAPLMYTVITWALGPFQFVGVVLLVSHFTGIGNTSPVSNWVVLIWSFTLAYFIWAYSEGLRINRSVSKFTRRKKFGLGTLLFGGLICNRSHKLKNLTDTLIMAPLVYAFTAVEAFSAFLGIWRFLKKNYSFEVINKTK